MRAAGTTTIFLLLSVGIAAAGWGWWVQFESSNDALRYFSSSDARRIQSASSVFLRELQAIDDGQRLNSEDVELDQGIVSISRDASFEISREFDASDWRGLSHLRHSLLLDSSYNWDCKFDEATNDRNWSKQIIFKDETGVTCLWLRLDDADAEPAIRKDGASNSLSLRPVAIALKEVLKAGLDEEIHSELGEDLPLETKER